MTKKKNTLFLRRVTNDLRRAALENPHFNLLAPDADRQLKSFERHVYARNGPPRRNAIHLNLTNKHQNILKNYERSSQLSDRQRYIYDMIRLDRGMVDAREARWIESRKVSMLEKEAIDTARRDVAVRELNFLRQNPHLPVPKNDIKRLEKDLGLHNNSQSMSSPGTPSRSLSRASSRNTFTTANESLASTPRSFRSARSSAFM
jgi:hypothetical protein